MSRPWSCLRLQTINYLNSIDENSNAKNLLNIALTNIEFRFSSMGEEELRVSDEFNTTLQRTREAFRSTGEKLFLSDNEVENFSFEQYTP